MISKIRIHLSEGEKKAYFAYLNKYLNKEILKAAQNQENLYFKQAKKDLEEILSRYSQEAPTIRNYFERRAIKYIDILESYKLVKYQFSRYSDLKKSLSEAVYSTIALEAVRNLKNREGEKLNISDIGCGPSRFAYEMIDFFPNAKIELYDFSITNLFLAQKLLCSGKEVVVPIRNIRNIGNTIERNIGDTMLIKIPAKESKNISLNLCNLENQLPLKDNSYDLINSTHCINLLSNPDKIILNLIEKLRKEGILITSDLLGWKEDRPRDKRKFFDGVEFYNFFNRLKGTKMLTYWYGGPYIEELNSERQDHYINHMVVLQRL